MRMRELIAALSEQPIHRARGTEILSFIEQRGIHDGGLAVLEASSCRRAKTAWRSARQTARLLEAERTFHKVKGFRELPSLFC